MTRIRLDPNPLPHHKKTAGNVVLFGVVNLEGFIPDPDQGKSSGSDQIRIRPQLFEHVRKFEENTGTV